MLLALLWMACGKDGDSGLPPVDSRPPDTDPAVSDTDSGRDSSRESVPPLDTDTEAPPTDTDTASDTASDTGDPPYVGDCSGGSGWASGGWLTDLGESSPEYVASAFVYVPKSLPACAPLVFFAHGGTDAGGYMDGEWIDRLESGLVELAEERGFVLVVPGVVEGPSSPHLWGDEQVVLDHLDALVEGAQAGADLDRDRTWFIGQSAGGHMSVYLGLYVVQPWTAIGAVSCGIGGYFDYPSLEPEEKLPFYVAHDPEDIVVDYSYALQLEEDLIEHGHEYTFTQWEMGSNGHSWAEGLSEAILDWFWSLK